MFIKLLVINAGNCEEILYDADEEEEEEEEEERERSTLCLNSVNSNQLVHLH